MRLPALLAAAAAVAFVALPGAAAGAVPSPSPPTSYSQKKQCVTADTTRPAVRDGVSWAQRQLDYPSLWSLATGKGVKIAVIDTGVTPNPAFGNRLHGLGDYVVKGGDGLSDCDGHGTLVAGIIAATPDPSSGFAGVAPDATVYSIRQSSNNYVTTDPRTGNQQSAGSPASLAAAIDWAVAHGVDVINISEASCGPGDASVPQSLRSAVGNAIAKGVVVVAAAGNVDNSTQCAQQNTPGKRPAVIAAPANLPGVLAVGAVDQSGQPAAFSLAGPWVGVAAPGTGIVATTPVPNSTGQIDEESADSNGVSTIQGTSFAAPYVTGLVALIKQRFAAQHLTPAQIVARIEQTAQHPAASGGRDEYVGYGMIDPRAALTLVLPGPGGSSVPHPAALQVAAAARDPEHHARVVALLGTVAVLAMIVAAGVAVSTRRARRSSSSSAGGGGRQR